MAQFFSVLGHFTGKLGNVVGYTVNGVPHVRALPVKKNRNYSQQQLAQQVRFRICSQFLNPMSCLLKKTFRYSSSKKAPFNMAFSHTLKHAITGNYPDFRIDYSSILLSKGSLYNTFQAAASSSGGRINFTWTHVPGICNTSPTDKSILVVYCPSKKQCIHTLDGPARSDQKASLDVAAFKGQQVHTYLAFISADRKRVSTSEYLGEWIVR